MVTGDIHKKLLTKLLLHNNYLLTAQETLCKILWNPHSNILKIKQKPNFFLHFWDFYYFMKCKHYILYGTFIDGTAWQGCNIRLQIMFSTRKKGRSQYQRVLIQGLVSSLCLLWISVCPYRYSITETGISTYNSHLSLNCLHCIYSIYYIFSILS